MSQTTPIIPDTVEGAVKGLHEMKNRAVALMSLNFERFRELTVLLCEKQMEDIDYTAFEYTPKGPLLALWRRGMRTPAEIAKHIGAYSVN